MNEVDKNAEEIRSFMDQFNLMDLLFSFCDWALGVIVNIAIALLIWVIGKKVINIITKLTRKMLERSKLDKGVISFTISFERVVLIIFLLFVVIDNLGIKTTSLLTVLGTASLAIGMSLQGSLANFAGGVLILIFKPFKIDDYIVVGTHEGTVIAIDILYTKLRTADNKIISMPNGSLANSNVVNIGAEPIRRLDLEIGISYSSDVKKAKELLLEILNKENRILREKPVDVIVKKLDNSSVILETRTYVNNADYWDVRFGLNEQFKEIFDANGIEIPFNQLDVHVN